MSKLLTEPRNGYVKPKDGASSGIYPKTLVEGVYWDEKKMTLEEALENGASASAETEIPVDGMKPNTVYNLGTITENTTFVMAEGEEGKVNHYFWVFETGADVPEITWPEGIRLWKDNTAPVIAANHHYEISVYDGVALYIAIEMHDPMLSMPLTFEILSDGNILWLVDDGSAQTIEYSKNGGEWTSITATADGAEIPVVTGDNLRFRGTAWPSGQNTCLFGSTCEFSVKGNPSSLKYGDVLTGNEVMEEECLSSLFYGCTGLTSAENLALPATTLAEGCYLGMFKGCTSLTEAPELPATTLAECCYQDMFKFCSSLVKAPVLPATTLVHGCYVEMFDGCTALSSVKCLITDTSVNFTTNGWLNNVAATGTFTKKAGVNWPSGASGIPEGWSVVEES